MQNIRIFFTKTDRAKYISHLDMNRLMQRALKRAKLPVWYTEGFNPHMYMTFSLPLSLGFESICETLDMRLIDELDLETVKDQLNVVLPSGIEVKRVAEPVYKPSVIAYASYQISLNCDADTFYNLERFLEYEHIEVEKKSKAGIKTVDLKPLIRQFELTQGQDGKSLLITLSAGSVDNVNPQLLVSAFEECASTPLEVFNIRRTGVFTKEFLPFL